ncbi:MAG TPA: hypothetical protein VH643_28515, partial [Gemmataceae bacterium]
DSDDRDLRLIFARIDEEHVRSFHGEHLNLRGKRREVTAASQPAARSISLSVRNLLRRGARDVTKGWRRKEDRLDLFSFPSSAWERTSGSSASRLARTAKRSFATVRSQAELGNESLHPSSF